MIVDALIGAGILTFCLGLYKLANGRLAKKVNQDTCKANVDGIHELLKGHVDHMDKRFDDLKDTIEKNGRR